MPGELQAVSTRQAFDARPHGRTPLPADELYQRGVDENNQQRPRRARRTLTRAWERATDDHLRARIAGSLAYSLSQLGLSDEAEGVCRDALRSPDLSEETRALLLGQLGTVLLHTGRWQEALDALSRALEGTGERAARGGLLVNRSVAAMRLRDLDLAKRDLDEAVECFEDTGDAGFDRAQALHNRGYVALLEGDIITALRLMSEARPIAAAASPAAAAICDVDHAEALRDAGDIDEAERLLAEAADVFGRQRMPLSRGEAEYALAQSLLTDDPQRAATTARRAAARLRRIGSEQLALQADAIRMRALLAQPGARRPAPGEVARVAAALSRQGKRGDSRALRLSQSIAAARAGEPQRGVPRLERTDSLTVRLLAHEARAARSTALGRERDVRRHAAAGLAELSDWQSSFGSLDLLTSVTRRARGLLVEGLSSALRTGRAETVFDWSERVRHFAHQVAPLRPPRDPQLADDLGQLRTLRAELQSSDWLDDARVAELRERIDDRRRTVTGGTAGHVRATLGELRAELDRETTLLSYVYVPGRLACVVVSGDPSRRPVLVELPWARIRSRMRGIHEGLEAIALTRGTASEALVRGDLDARLADLSRLLAEKPLVAAGDPRRVVITTPGVLREVVWSMLPAMSGRVVTQPRSATWWVRGHRRPSPLRSVGFAVGPRVPRGAEEAHVGSAAWLGAAGRADPEAGERSVTVLSGAEADVAAVTDLAERVDVLHVSAHGRHAYTSPLLSGFAMADGPIFGYDIDLVEHPPQLVVLSACELGRSSTRWGEEAFGMARSWLHAGSHCVVASPVIVADDIACEVLGTMHEGLAAGLEPAEALQHAATKTGHLTPFLCHGAGF